MTLAPKNAPFAPALLSVGRGAFGRSPAHEARRCPSQFHPRLSNKSQNIPPQKKLNKINKNSIARVYILSLTLSSPQSQRISTVNVLFFSNLHFFHRMWTIYLPRKFKAALGQGSQRKQSRSALVCVNLVDRESKACSTKSTEPFNDQHPDKGRDITTFGRRTTRASFKSSWWMCCTTDNHPVMGLVDKIYLGQRNKTTVASPRPDFLFIKIT